MWDVALSFNYHWLVGGGNGILEASWVKESRSSGDLGMVQFRRSLTMEKENDDLTDTTVKKCVYKSGN